MEFNKFQIRKDRKPEVYRLYPDNCTVVKNLTFLVNYGKILCFAGGRGTGSDRVQRIRSDDTTAGRRNNTASSGAFRHSLQCRRTSPRVIYLNVISLSYVHAILLSRVL